MIDCTNQNIWYKNKRRFSFKRFFVLLLIVLIIAIVYFYYVNVVCERIFKICYAYADSYCTESVNKAILKSMQKSDDYANLVTIEKNDNDDIVLISTNPEMVNKLSREIALECSKSLNEKFNEGIKLPLMIFTGIDILSGYGVPVNLRTLSIVSVDCDFNSEFKSVGINQTLHSIYVIINCKVEIEVPFNATENTLETKVLVSESVLVGEVPEIYLGGN